MNFRQQNPTEFRPTPFAFWVNNDHDAPAAGGKPDRDVTNVTRPDRAYGHIRCPRNLEDFARLWVCGLPALPASQGYTITLSLSASHGSPAINLYRAYDPEGGTGYLTDTNNANQQFTRQEFQGQVVFDYAQALAQVRPGQSYTLPVNVTDGQPQFTRLLFEGAGQGTGQLVLTIAQGTNILAQTSAWIELRDVKDLYEQAVVENVVQDWPDMVEREVSSTFRVLHSPALDPSQSVEVAVFVHGWRMGVWDYLNFSDTMFKRLYWQGFRGRFAALRWPTRSADSDPFFGLDYATYNRSEHIAFKSATGTAGYFSNLRERFPNHTISVCAHSMGNVVMMEALKQLVVASQAPIDNYVLMQAAVPAQCYDTTVTNLLAFVTMEQTVPTPNTYNGYAVGIAAALRGSGQLVNFFSPVDFALTAGLLGTHIGSWEFNQSFFESTDHGTVTMKPNTLLGYYTDGDNNTITTNYWNQTLFSILYGGYYGSGTTHTVTNQHEIMPFVSRPRSKAIGAQGAVQGVIQGGEVNLQSDFGFTDATFDHSGQWNRSIQDPVVGLFCVELRARLFPPQ